MVGLGNYGKEYEGTRHNVGFELVEKLAGSLKFTYESKFEAWCCHERGFLFVKPQTFMNESGRAVKKIVSFYKSDIHDLVLIHDDLDLKLGEYKIQRGIGPKAHNGVTSVEGELSEREFLRVRMGIDGRDGRGYMGSGADYVLSKFDKDEREILEDVIDEVADELLVTLGLN